MSKERFAWLREIGAEVIATPGCESNVKEIYDECWRIREHRKDCVIFNQFEEFGNALWHYEVTGGFIDELFTQLARPGDRLAAFVSATGSAGTINAGEFLLTRHPHAKIVAAEAQQCPTLYCNGFGGHRIEGIGDKHVPWIHNVRNTDVVTAIDDEQCMALFRLFNEPAGREVLVAEGLAETFLNQLDLCGISGICNLVSAIKTAKYYELNEKDVLFFPQTDSAGMYGSRLEELSAERGAYTRDQAGRDFARYLQGVGTDWLRELNFQDRKALHNLKYFTWVEQQGRTSEDLRRLWDPEFWTATFAQAGKIDAMIEAFNARVGLN
jgi:cysteine synthase